MSNFHRAEAVGEVGRADKERKLEVLRPLWRNGVWRRKLLRLKLYTTVCCTQRGMRHARYYELAVRGELQT